MDKEQVRKEVLKEVFLPELMTDEERLNEEQALKEAFGSEWKDVWNELESEIDPGVRPIVVELVRNGIRTTYSCDGHEFGKPMIRFIGDPHIAAQVLIQMGYHKFSIEKDELGYTIWFDESL